MVVMKDVAIAKSEFRKGEQAVTKIQEYQSDPVLFEYCALPQVGPVCQQLPRGNLYGIPLDTQPFQPEGSCRILACNFFTLFEKLVKKTLQNRDSNPRPLNYPTSVHW